MDARSVSAYPMPKRLAAEQLGDLMAASLRQLKIPRPSTEELEDLVRYVADGPIGEHDRTKHISSTSWEHLVALRNALPEVERYWTRVYETGIRPAPGKSAVTEMQRVELHEAFLAPLVRLRSAMEECERLIAERPGRYKEEWEDAADSLFMVLRWIARRHDKTVGISAGPDGGGPSCKFVAAGLEALGWRRGTEPYPSDGAIAQHLKRTRRNRDK